MRPVITTEERRRRLAVRHHLARPTAEPVTVASDLVGLHSSDPATVHLTAWARVVDYSADQLEADLYERRALLRMLGMRRTMFVVPPDLAAVMDAACTRDLAPSERRRLVRLIEEQSLAEDGTAWVRRVSLATLRALGRRGQATAAQLVEDVPELGLRLSFGEGSKWAGEVGLSTRILFLLATEGRIVRGRPLGTWRSSQYQWSTVEAWLGEPLPRVDPAQARADLARRWLTSYGPGTETDLTWWTGWTKTRTRRALSDVGAVTVDLADGQGFVLDSDCERTPDVAPWVALLPSLDPTVMGWKQREWYLGDLGYLAESGGSGGLSGPYGQLFDRNGNAGPTVWCDGRVVGGWAQRRDGEVVVRLLGDVGSEAASEVRDQADRLQRWLGDHRVVSRFPSPVERSLRA